MWEDITKEPYKKIFNAGVVGTHLWYKVKILRKINHDLNSAHKLLSGRESMYAIHGNRFVAHLVFDKLKKSGLGIPNGHDYNQVVATIPGLVNETVKEVVKAADELFPDAYLAVLFKNTPKCKAIARKLTETSKPDPRQEATKAVSLFD